MQGAALSNAGDYRDRYVRLRDEYGVLSYFVDELRDRIVHAARHDRMADTQRDELLSLVDEIDQERQALVGSA